MKQNSLIKAFLCVCCFFSALNTVAQEKVFAGSVSAYATNPVFPFNSYVDNVGQAVDDNLNTAATVRANSGTAVGLGAYSGYIELQFSSTLSANTTSYVKITTDDNILPYLLGGSLGGLLSDVAGGLLIGNQRFSVNVKNNSTSVLTGSSWVTSDFSGSRLRVVYNDAGDYFLMITPNAAYNRIRITNSLGSLIGANTTKNLNVYEAFYIDDNADCGIGSYTSFNSAGVTLNLLDLGGTSVTNPEYLIDADISNYSQLNIGVLGVAASVSQSVYFEGPSGVDDEYDIKFQVPPGLLELDVLDNIEVIVYNGATQTQAYDLSALVTLDLLDLLAANEPVSVSITPGIADRIEVRLSTLVGVTVEQSINLYGIVKGDFDVAVTGGGSYAVDDVVTLEADAQGCNGPYTYFWSGDITASGAEVSPSTATPGTYNFMVTVTDKYGITKIESSQIVVEAPPVAGNITGGQNVCEGMLPPDLVLENYTGEVLYWESSSDLAFTSPTTLAVTSETLDSATIGEITETTYYRAVVGNFTYDPVFTDPATLSIKSTTWNGTAWSDGVPDINVTVYFTGDYNEDADLFACAVEVNNNAQVVIPSDNNVTVNGAVNVVQGSFLIEDNTNLVQLTDAVNSGDVQIEKNSSALYRLDYTLWSSPVEGQNLLDFSPQTLTNRFYDYNESTDLYYAIAPGSTDFAVGHSYLIRMPNNHPAYVNDTIPGTPWTGTFEGVPNNGTIYKVMENTFNGYNLMGNPYPSAINIHDFFDANEGIIDSGSPLYFWRKRNDQTVSTYATITKSAYVSNNVVGGDTGSHIFIGDPSEWVINTGQGFFLQASGGGTLVFNNSMRRTVNNGQFFRQEQQGVPEMSRLWLDITGNENEFKQMAIAYTNQGTLGLDYGWDGKAVIDDGAIALYTVVEGMEIGIQTRPEFQVNDVVSIAYKVTNPGTYTISLDHFDGVFLYGQDIYLKDNVTKQVVDLKNIDYMFTTEAGEFTNRFEIVYTTQGVLDANNNEVMPNDVVVYQKDGLITIDGGAVDVKHIAVYDVRGRLIYTKPSINTNTITITDLAVQQQVVLLHITTVKGLVTKKVVM